LLLVLGQADSATPSSQGQPNRALCEKFATKRSSIQIHSSETKPNRNPNLTYPTNPTKPTI